MDHSYFIELLKEKGLKVTNQRIVVLESLANHPGEHLTSEEIYDLVKTEHPEIGLATVYRTVQLLLELKLIDKVNFDDGMGRYEFVSETGTKTGHHHHHLICMSCGSVYSFEDDLLDQLEECIENRTGFHVINHEVKLYGYCEKCRKEKQ